MKSNITAFRKLIKKYKSITKKDVIAIMNRNDLSPINYTLKKNLTGFGYTNYCTLCTDAYKIAVKEKDSKYLGVCEHCIYLQLTNHDCNNGINKITYDYIANAKDITTLIKAYRKRADHMKSILSENNIKL